MTPQIGSICCCGCIQIGAIPPSGYRHKCRIIFLDESIREFGFEYVSLQISGKYAYGHLKSEQGIHQIKRTSPFNKDSKIHTSFADVEVTPIIDESLDFQIPIEDLEITSRVSPHGRCSWATILHIHTGISTTSSSLRSQLQNKQKALTIVKSKLFALMQSQNATLSNIKKPTSENKTNNPIREYIFHPYKKVKDLRTKLETSDIEEVLKGNLDMFIKAYLKHTC
ncbi:MAG: PCRF domain-containing protein [Rivularia sp. ALOHA_DT_140]|nr:PCRF domain-containing protein [Rivularia sp. ALOHA_DT_140]